MNFTWIARIGETLRKTAPEQPVQVRRTPAVKEYRQDGMDVMLNVLTYMLEAHAQQSKYYTPFQKVVWHSLYTDPKNARLSSEERRERRLKMLGDDEWTPEVWRTAQNFWNQRCAACGRKSQGLHRDHLIPVASVKTPGSIPSNLIPLCGSCNLGKSADDFCTWWEKTFDDGDPVTRSRKLMRIIQKIHEWQSFCWYTKGWN